MNGLITTKTVSVGLPPLSMAWPTERFLASKTPALTSTNPVWETTQIEALASLQRVVDEGFVFGAVTGPIKSGKSAIINKLLASSQSKNRACVHIPAPHQVSAKEVDAMAKAITKIRDGFTECEMSILIIVDDAQNASQELLILLDRFAAARSALGSIQIVLAGQPNLWNRLGTNSCEKLLQRIALRCSLCEPSQTS